MAYNAKAFQYISCYSLSIWKISVPYHNRVSIHLMLLFIAGIDSENVLSTSFQYISCYSLSFLYREFDNKFHSFNTSHITLYRSSSWFVPSTIRQFQYISCYSLSVEPKNITTIEARFNTSHVTLYLQCWQWAWWF